MRKDRNTSNSQMMKNNPCRLCSITVGPGRVVDIGFDHFNQVGMALRK